MTLDNNRGYACFHVELTTMPFLVFIHFHIGIYLSEHNLKTMGQVDVAFFTEKFEKRFCFPFNMADNQKLIIQIK